MKNIQQPDLQLRALRLYGEFLCRRGSWSGQLALAAFVGASDAGFAAAASLAGASSLVVDADSESMKAHFRDGAFDFIVNTLDEALRTIKNEIRRGRPIAIGLMAEPVDALEEAAERGLAVQFVLCGPGNEQVSLLDAVSDPDTFRVDDAESKAPSPELARWLLQHQWTPAEIALPKREAPAVDGEIRGKWLRDLPTHQRSVRRGNRWVWLSSDEPRELTVNPG